jgi:hypothetical protein
MTTDSPGFNKSGSHQLFPDAVVALILPILPNVQKWTVGDIDRPTYAGKAIQRAKDGIFGSISVAHVELLPDTRHSQQPGQTTASRHSRSFRICRLSKVSVGRELEELELMMGDRITTYPARHLLYARFI